ncbi:TPA: S8 family serine peptidase [Streptococcus pneumoniae]|uniref:S8 family serine peptidase n=1 Tax=Streptococcus pneumoniae TaxID=1313 RepID=UPI0005E84AAF|nr:S8 family serine peptidase [Streptococcus pneumoniae]CTP35706.1 putative surface-anchored serine protease [Streptococcus pneumoniae]CTP45279.1 putative surface-anchored serine protease [Streptococcus pneumoniae]CVN28288.1 cell wall-associated serine proteinase [Streptococcus pneumoniae]CWJ82995.1 cell wall-associated serine proteinase [Streptococcus pneumoniae]SND62135.1 cell wall-associated serine proteinase [Streptococcus pneumoniae]
MKKSTVLSLTTAAVVLAAYVPNEVVLADTSSSEDALTISDTEKVVVDKEAENKEKHENIHNDIETSKDTEEKKTTVIEEKEVVSKESVIDNKTSNEEATIKEDSNQSQEDKANSSASKDPESPKKEDKLVYIAEFKDKESGEKAIKELSNLKDTNVLYTYNTIFNGVSIETTPDNLDKIKLIEGISSVERSQKLQPMMNHARKEIGVEEAIDYLKSINAPFGKNFDGRGMVISNIDTGTDYRHKAMRIDDDAKGSMRFKKEDLKGTDKNFWLSDKIPHAFNYYNGGKITVEKADDGSDYFDPHGMHIAGILAGNDTEKDIKNFNGIDGIAPNAQIFSYKMYSDAGSGFAGDETMFHAIEDSIKHNVDVVSVSSGFTGTGLVGEKYWQAIRALRKAGIPMVVATGNYATSASSSSWDLVANNHLKMTDTGNVTRTAAHEDAIAVASAKNQTVEFDKVKIGGKNFKYRNIGAFFDKNKITTNEDGSKAPDKLKFVYIGKGQDQELIGLNLKGKIAVMDRIYTKDLKNAFKKATDKGARAIMVVNTVNYYNRDNWTELPAMGYEADEATKSQVFSISGDDGVKLWNMINPDKKTEVKRNNKEDFKDKLEQYYPIDMESFNSNKPNVGDEKEIDFKFAPDTDRELYKEDIIVPAGSTSWGPRVDLLLKPDVSAPGKNIKSTLNVINGKSTYGYMSGTSMATPIVAASTVLIRPKLKEMLERPVLKNLEGDDKIDLTSLTKIALQNTARPMMDATSWKEKSQYFASPRQQGAGLINVANALRNEVVATFKNKDSKGLVNSYGSISLKEIKGEEKYFTVKLHNTSDRPLTFKVSASAITTDSLTDRLKLDETYKDEKSPDGKQIVPEIHPEKIKGANITFEHDTFTIGANSSFDLNAVINVGEAKDKNKFVESFIHFESVEEMEALNSNGKKINFQPSLSMPLMGFAGNWNHEPILDKWAWEEGSKSKTMEGYDDDGKPKIPGTLNKGIGGEHGIDKFNPAAIIQNRKDKNITSLDQDPDLFAFNNQGIHAESTSGSNVARVYPLDSKGEPQSVSLERGLTPSPLVLRSAEEGLISIVNINKEGENQRDLKVISREHFIRGILNSKSNDAKGIKSSKLKVWGDLKWDGLIYNPRGREENAPESKDNQDPATRIRGQFEPIAEGQYFYKFKYRLTKDYPWQVSYIPVKIDNTAPRIISIDFSNPDKIKLIAKDTYHKVKDEYKHETLFARDQKEHPEKFEEVANEVWYAGAALVDKYGDVEKNLDVTYAGEGEGRNRKLDKDGNTIYEISGAGDLRGKIIEVIALDGASNFTKIHRIKFADKADKNGMISYYLVDPDKDASSYKKLGEISEDKLKNAQSPEASNNVEEKKETVEEKPIEGPSTLELDKEISTVRNFENKDLKKLIKKKYKEEEDFVNGGKRKVELDYRYDTKGNITAYVDGSALEYETEKLDDVKSKLGGVLSPSKDGHFEILGKVSNVSKNAKAYYGNGFKLIEIKASKYDPQTKTLTFDLFANTNDVVDGLSFTGDMNILVKDKGKTKAKTKIRMPGKNRETKTEYPYASSYGNVIELGEGDLSKNKPNNLTEMESGKIYSDSEKQQYLLKDNIILRKGYALKVTTYNPGKTDMLEGNGVYSKEDIAKIQKANPNLRVLSETTIYADSRNVEDGRSTQAVLMSALDGFNIIRYQVFTFKMNDKGEAIDKDGNLVTDSSKLVLFGKDDKEYTGEDKSNVEAIKEDGSMLFIDTKPVNLSMDKNYFNPSKSNKIYVRNPEFYLRGKISDKGGFNWELRVNESVVDNYLIYGDLHIDNTRDFNIKLNVKDGDIMDWGMKDYKANGFPDKVTDMDGNVYLQTGYSDLNAKAVGVHYQFLYDNVKPEVNIDPKGNTSIEYADGKSVVFNINDKRNNGFDGEIQEQHIYVNGKEYTSFDDIKQITDKTLNIKIVVKDFARNTTVKEFILNKDTGEVSELKPHRVTVTIQNGKEMSSTIVSEEDFILPVYKGELEKGYQFDGWEISGFEGKKDAGYVINLSKDTFIKPVFKKIEEKKEEENKPTFDVSKKKDNPQVNHSQLNESHRKEDLQREDHSQKSDSTKDVTATVLDKNNISSKSTTNNPNKLPKTGTASGAQTLLAAGIMFIVGIFLGLKKKNQD